MLAISHQYTRFRDNQRAQRFLAGVNPAVVGLILSAALLLGRGALISWHGYALLVLAFALLAVLRWHPAFVLAIGAVAGYFGLLPRLLGGVTGAQSDQNVSDNLRGFSRAALKSVLARVWCRLTESSGESRQISTQTLYTSPGRVHMGRRYLA
jgi:chromate transport protein ChrA